MSVNQNLARILHRVKAERELSYAEFANELGIPKSSLVEYMNGTGNPRADTLELLSEKLNLPITEIISDPLLGEERAEMIVRTAKAFSGLPPEQRERGFQLFQDLAALFAEESIT